MTQESIQPVLDWISAHPMWSGFVVFLISLSESLAIVGLVVPGVVLMTAIGGMMGSGVLPFWLTLFWAILGAIAGDGISYWLGYHYHEHLRDFWPFRQFPKLLARGETFFRHHGGKSIVFGRFVGPVRPMIPVIAGMMDMPPKRFLFFNILSAFAWAPLYSLPGILIGASLGNLSSEVASRAGLLVLLLLLVFWLFYETLLLIGAWIAATVHTLVNFIWQILNRIAWLSRILKTAQGTEVNQFGIALLFLLSTMAFVFTTYDVLNSEGIASWNESVYQVFRALYSDKLIALIGLLTGFGDPEVLLPSAAVIGLWLLWRKRYRTATVWILTIAVGFIAGFFTKNETMVPRPEGLKYVFDHFAYPSAHVLSSTLVFGLAAAFIQHSLSAKHRWIPWFIVIPIIILISLSRIYLGMHWFTDVMGSLTLGAAFVALGTFVFRRVVSRHVPIRAILLPGLITIAVMFGIYRAHSYPLLQQELVRQWPIQTLEEKSWWTGHGPSNGLYRTGAFKRQATVFDVQWLGSLENIQHILEHAGWKVAPKLNFKTSVMLLASNPSPILFPVLPKFHRDRLPVITVTKALNQQDRLVLQLWQSDYLTQNNLSLWVGTLRLEEAAHPLPLVTLYLEHPYIGDILKQLTLGLKAEGNVQMHTFTAKNANNHKVLLLKSN